MNYDVSIIVPIYNVDSYIENCVISLFEQDFRSIEYIFVNDCTPDNSIDVLERLIRLYPNRESDIKIIHHSENRGLGATRKTGVMAANGKYIVHIDSDDWCELNMVSCLYQKAIETDADIVVCDFFLSYSDVKERVIKQKIDEKRYFYELLSFSISPACWNKLIKRDLYIKNNIYPPINISMSEDMHLLIRLSYFAQKTSYLNVPLYHYRKDNYNALTNNFNEKALEDIRSCFLDINAFFIKNNAPKYYRDVLIASILYIVLDSSSNYDYKKNISYILPEADKLKYLWLIPLSIPKKFVYSFYVVNMGFIVSWMRPLYRFIKRYV